MTIAGPDATSGFAALLIVLYEANSRVPVALRRPMLVLAALVCGYAFAWVGHFFVEHNRPATFQHPLWSFRADFKMLGCALSGRLASELQRAGVSAG